MTFPSLLFRSLSLLRQLSISFLFFLIAFKIEYQKKKTEKKRYRKRLVVAGCLTSSVFRLLRVSVVW